MSFRTILDVLNPRVCHTRLRSARPLRLESLDERTLPSGYVQANLASDIPGQAQIHDPDLVDAWGISINPGATGTFWVSGRATDVSTIYSGDVNGKPFVENPLVVDIPGGRPTGQVFNPPGTDFMISDGTTTARAGFIFASETGHITGWNPTVAGPPTPSPNAVLMASTPGAVYTGLAIHNNPAGSFLYAADFAGGKIDVFDREWNPTTLSGSFVDPDVPAKYDAFNIWNLGGKLYVAYALQENGDALPDGGHGYVSVFDTNGNLLSHLVDDSHLKEPWGMAIAPANFGEFSNALLVANTGNGKIDGYDPATGAFLGRLADPSGESIHIDGLWALHFGNGTFSGDRNALYFTASGHNHEHGLFGSLRVAPEAVAAAMDSAPEEAAPLVSALTGTESRKVDLSVERSATGIEDDAQAPSGDALAVEAPVGSLTEETDSIELPSLGDVFIGESWLDDGMSPAAGE